MKLRCERDVLAEALATVTRVASGRSGPGGVRIELSGDRLNLLGSDSELSIETTVEVTGLADGACVVPGRLVGDIVRALPSGAVTMEADEDEAHIAAGRSQFDVRSSPEMDFPRPVTPLAEGVEVGAEELGEALRQVVLAASSDMERPSLTGVLVAAEEGGLRFVATDSYRLALRDLVGTSMLAEGQRVLVPARSLSELQRLLGGGSARGSVSVRTGELEVAFALGPVRLTSRLLRAEFPNYLPLIPKDHPNKLVVQKAAILEALRRVRLLVRDSASAVRVTMRPELVELRATSAEVGQASEDLDADYQGDELTLAFNPSFLIDGIEAVPGEAVLIETLDSKKPALIRAVDSIEYRYVLMPVRVS